VTRTPTGNRMEDMTQVAAILGRYLRPNSSNQDRLFILLLIPSFSFDTPMLTFGSKELCVQGQPIRTLSSIRSLACGNSITFLAAVELSPTGFAENPTVRAMCIYFFQRQTLVHPAGLQQNSWRHGARALLQSPLSLSRS